MEEKKPEPVQRVEEPKPAPQPKPQPDAREKAQKSGLLKLQDQLADLRDNAVLDHFGMHSSGLNFYEGCSDILFEGNYVHNTIAINRNAERLTFKNNVIDGLGKGSVAVGMWTSGSVGGRAMKDIHFINNTFVRQEYDRYGELIRIDAGTRAPPR